MNCKVKIKCGWCGGVGRSDSVFIWDTRVNQKCIYCNGTGLLWEDIDIFDLQIPSRVHKLKYIKNSRPLRKSR